MRLIDADDIPYVDLNGDMPASDIRVWVAFKDRIDSMPTIGISAIEERKKGSWIPQEDENGDPYGDKCSECGARYVMPEGKTNYCPVCGADMRGEQDE